jgi:eukaryotic-like serine/threonine-protein kinase
VSRLRNIETIYNDALTLKSGERAAFLDRVCNDDGDLRREVESLLAYAPQAETYMATPALQQAAESLAQEGKGTLVARTLGRYQLLSLVGQGGMAEVYCGVDSRLNRLVAVKVLPVYMASDRERVQRFEQEARAVAALNHPCICTLHDVGNEDGVHYLVFEYLAGEPLSERLVKGAVPFPEALEYAIQIADAVACAHEQEIIHLDLKPSNVMLTRTGVKLLDFGIAELRHPDMPDSTDTIRTNTADSGVRTPGTLGYMAPEQLEGRETDCRTDIFAFGAVLYEMFTGRRAFPNPASVLNRPPTPIATETPTVPPAVDSLVARCLAQNPSERWQSVSEVLARLRDIRATQ